MVKVYGQLCLALSFFLFLSTTLTRVSALNVETEEAFFSKLTSYVEFFDAANATDLSS